MAQTATTPESLRSNFGVADYSVFVLFLVCSALIGVFFGWKGRKNKNNKDFLTGNRNLPIFPVVMSLAASFMSTNTILGVPAEVYTLGTQFYMSMSCFMIAVVLSAEVFLPVFYQLNMTSVNEYLFLRFKSHKARLCGSLAFLMCTVSRQEKTTVRLLNALHAHCSCLTWELCCTVHRWHWRPSLDSRSITRSSLSASSARSTRRSEASKP